MDIYEECDYSSFNDFFTRKIKPDSRPVPEDIDVLISPCDCLATVYPIQENTTFSIKNTEYTFRSLLRSPRLEKDVYKRQWVCLQAKTAMGKTPRQSLICSPVIPNRLYGINYPLIVNKDNKVGDLKKEQVEAIFTGKITEWNKL